MRYYTCFQLLSAVNKALLKPIGEALLRLHEVYLFGSHMVTLLSQPPVSFKLEGPIGKCCAAKTAALIDGQHGDSYLFPLPKNAGRTKRAARKL